MAEQRLIDANNLIEEIREERCYNCRNFKDMKCDYCGTADYIYMIEDMPAADVAQVVRCKDCEHLVNATVNGNGFLICDISDMETAPDDFCSHGDRREEAGP